MALDKFSALSKGEQLRINAHILHLFNTDDMRHERSLGGFINDFRTAMKSLPGDVTLSQQQRFQITLDVLRENLAQHVHALPAVRSERITEDLTQAKATLRQVGEYISSEMRTDPRLKAKPAYYSPQQYKALTDPFFKAAAKHGSDLHPQEAIPVPIIGVIRENWRASGEISSSRVDEPQPTSHKVAASTQRTR